MGGEYTLLVLASDMATRLRPVLLRGEKHLIPAGGEPLIARTARVLEKVLGGAVNLVVVVRSENYDLYRTALSKFISGEVLHIVRNPLAKSSNSSYTMALGLKHIRDSGLSRDVIVMNGDVMLLDGKPGVRAPNTVSVMASYNYDKEHFMRVYVEGGRVKYVGLDIPPSIASAAMLGLYIPREHFNYFSKEFCRFVKVTGEVGWFEHLLNTMIISGLDIGVWPIGDNVIWWEIDELSDYIAATLLNNMLSYVSK